MIPGESVITSNQQFTPGEGLVLYTVPHALHINEFGFVAGCGKSDATSAGWISRSQSQARGTCLSRSITLDDGARENNTQEVEHLGIERGRTRSDELELPTEELSNLASPTLVPKCEDWENAHLFKDETVPERMGIDASGFELFELSIDRPPEQGSLETRSVGSGHDGLIDPVQQPGDRWEKIRLQDSQILDDSKRGTRVVTDSPSPSQNNQFCGSLRCNRSLSNTGGSLKTNVVTS